jgi:hypothetical protein
MGDRSPFRTGFQFLELYYDAAWHDHTDDLGDDGFTVNRTVRDAAAMTASLKDPTGRYSTRNPTSDLYGKIGRNTPVRAGVDMTGSDRRYLFWGVVASWQTRWSKTGTPSAYAALECSGVLRRLGQGASPLRSPIYRAISAIGAGLVGYWPMEEVEGSTRFASAVPTARYATWVGVPTLAGYDGFACSEPIPTVANSTFVAVVPNHTATGEAQVRWIARVPSTTPNAAVLVRVYCTGSLNRVDIQYSTGGAIRVTGYNRDSVSVGSGVYAFAVDDLDERMGIELTQSGGNVTCTFAETFVGATGGSVGGGTFTGVTLGRVSSIRVNPDRTSLGDLALGHLTVENDITTLFSVSQSVLQGYNNEYATVRIERLCAENGITLDSTGAVSPAERMGVQGLDTVVALLDEAAEVGQGFLFERRDAAGLKYRTLPSLCGQTPALDIAYVDNLLRPFEPVDDDQATRNRITLTRTDGGSATVEQTTGPLGTTTVGVYDESLTLSLANDDLAGLHAGWRLSLGTVDEARWPTIGLHLEDSYWLDDDTKTNAALAIDIGDRIRVSDLPAWLPPFPVDGLVVGMTHTVKPLELVIELTCVPAAPYQTGTYDGTARYSGDGTTTREDLDTTETGVDVLLPDNLAGWGHDDGDYDVLIGGEQMTVTAVSAVTTAGLERRQTLTVTRSVNGVVKTHTTGAAVTLAAPTKYAL